MVIHSPKLHSCTHNRHQFVDIDDPNDLNVDPFWFECSNCYGAVELGERSRDRDCGRNREQTAWWYLSVPSLSSFCCVSAWKHAKHHVKMNDLCCCAPCKPRYRRLVDSIYPRSVTDGLISGNMQKLTFYAISHPEKLERIGEYLVLRLARDLGRQRYVPVKIAVEAMDLLLQSSHSSPSLAQFTENYLRMVQKLLESGHSRMEQLATDSFVTFSNIEENCPSYHRQYDFFISKFSQMCHATGADGRNTRIAGLRGLRGVVWKSVTDDLHPNIWEQQHMDKIVPSILYNLQNDEKNETTGKTQMFEGPILEDSGREQDLQSLADRCLRELMGKASFGSLRAVMEPMLQHMDLHQQWQPPPDFAIHVFRAIIYSIQSQNSYFVIQELINHLDSMSTADASIRIGIATVLSNIVSVAGTSIGPLLLSIFNSLLKHLRTSVDFERSGKCRNVTAEKSYQEALINAMGDFANGLPDYQKVEMMMFTVGNIPNLDGGRFKQGDEFLQHVLVKTLLKVATKYRTAYLATVFTDSFLNTLVQLALVKEAQVRLVTQKIFHTLLDRHDNLRQLGHMQYVLDLSDVQLTVEKCSRADQMFMRKHIHEMTQMLYQTALLMPEDETLDEHLDAVQCTCSLLCIEVGFDETLMELFRLSLGLQALALDPSFPFSAEKRLGLHNVVAKYMNLAAQLMANPSLCQHVQQVVSMRSNRAPVGMGLLPRETTQFQNDPNTTFALARQKYAQSDDSQERNDRAAVSSLIDEPQLMFDREVISEALKSTGKDVSRLSVAFVMTAAKAEEDHVDGPLGTQENPNITAGIDDVSMDLSVDWSPPTSVLQSRRNTIFSTHLNANTSGLPMSIETLKSMANSPIDVSEEQNKEREVTKAVLRDLRTKPFDTQVEEALAREETSGMARTLARLVVRNNETLKMAAIGRPPKPKNIFEMDLPAFVY